MSKVKNPLNYDYEKEYYQVITDISQTVPDQTMSIKTIMERYAKGLPIANGLSPIYEDDDYDSNGINPRTLDLVDIQELRRLNSDKIDYLTDTIKKSSKKQPKNSEETASEEEQH